jgi:HemK-related putative methylase
MRIERCQGVYEPEDDSYLLMGIEEIRGSLLEIGCGTGIVGLSYAEQGLNVTITDLSENAVKCSRKNALNNGVEVKVVRTNLFDGIKGRFDYCIFNPPYLPVDPPDNGWWTGGTRGNEMTISFLRAFKQFAGVAFYIESSLSSVPREMFGELKFEEIRKINYDFEDLKLIKVSQNALNR